MRIAGLAAALTAAIAVAAVPSLEETLEHLETIRLERALTRVRKQQVSSTPVYATTKQGTVIGFRGSDDIKYFLGIPFAAPPVGELRWQPPQAPAAWGIRNATWFGPACPQSGLTWTFQSGQSEDCLNLNVYVPAAAPPPGGYPVMLFIHGGSWVYGAGSSVMYLGGEFVKTTNDAIVVATNYRLGALGFLGGDAMRPGSMDGSVGNYGLQDQRFAMQWIKANIAAFGGNPNMLTIWGESAGAGSVAAHIVIPRSRGLFQRGIMQSGAWSVWSSQPYAIANTRFSVFTQASGCAGKSTDAETMDCLRQLSVNDILSHSRQVPSGIISWAPVIDGVEVPADVRTLLAEGKAAPVDVLFGWNHDEGTLFTRVPRDINSTQFEPELANYIGSENAQNALKYYNPNDYQSPWWCLATLFRDGAFLCPGKKDASLLTKTTGKNTFVYFYTHVYNIIQIVDLFRPLGCFHGSELLSLYDWEFIMSEGEKAMSQLFRSYWSTFAVSGSPNFEGAPTWPQYGTQGAIMEIDATATTYNATVLHTLGDTICEFWASVDIKDSIIFGSP